MKHTVKIALLVFAVAGYSCNSRSKKQAIDTLSNLNWQDSVIKLESLTPDRKQLYCNIIFPSFVIKLHDFGKGADDEITDSTRVIINKKTNGSWNLTAKSDTIGLRGYNFYNTMEFISKNQTDKFKVSYFYKLLILAVDDDVTRLSITPDYKYLKDSLIHFFRLPRQVANYTDFDEINYFKQKLKLNDTIAKNGNGDEVSGFVSYKNKICRIDKDNRIIIKIERFDANNKLVETKFLKIDLDVLEEAED